MSISVLCEECGKSFQVKDELAGRRGKCPRGHAIVVPTLEQAPTGGPQSDFEFATDFPSKDSHSSKKYGKRAPQIDDADDFAFSNGASQEPDEEEEAPPLPKKAGGKPKTPVKKAAANVEAAEEDFSSFPSESILNKDKDDEAPKSIRQKKGHKSHAKDDTKKSFMPMIIGSVLAIVGIGGGMAFFLIARGQVGPYQEEAEAANKKATDADLRAKTAEAQVAAADAKVKDFEQRTTTALASAKKAEDANKTTQTKSKDDAKKIAELEKKVTDMEAGAAAAGPAMVGGKKDPVVPGVVPGPKGGKNWTAPSSLTFGMLNHKAGDRLVITPTEDMVLKADNGTLRIKFKYSVPKGKEMPAEIVGTLFIAQAGSIDAQTMQVKLTEASGETEAVAQVKGYTGSGNITFMLSDGNLQAGTRNLKIYSTIVAMQAEFEKAKE
jgi:chemotaxis protein histidine kinase CheA